MMRTFIAALTMYDWPEMRAQTDAAWQRMGEALRQKGIEAPQQLIRCNAMMPPVPGGIRDTRGAYSAPDPATLPPDALDVQTLWQHPALLLGQTCWGPMEAGLQNHVQVVGQADYSAYEGGDRELYSSVILMRGEEGAISALPPSDGSTRIPLDRLHGRRLAYNETVSMSGMIALTRDLAALGKNLSVFCDRVETGSHRASALAVAQGQADVCAVDCRTWALIQRFEPMAATLRPVGWTARRKGLPYIASRHLPATIIEALRSTIITLDAVEPQPINLASSG